MCCLWNLGGGVTADEVMLSLLLLPDSPEPRLEFTVESLRLFTLFPDSPLPRRIESVLAVITVPPAIVDSRLDPHNRAKSERNSEIAVAEESLLLVEMLLIPESAELSRLFLTDDNELSVAVLRPHGRLFAKSASVSRLQS